jgi:hypothetical protein
MAEVLSPFTWIDLAEIKNHLGLNVPKVDASLDDALTQWANAVCEAIEGILERQVIQRDHTEYVDGNGGQFLYVRSPPIDQATCHVYVDNGTRKFTEELTQGMEIAEADYYIEPAAGSIELFSGRFPRGKKNVKVVYKGGWLLAAVPSPIKLAALITIQNLHAAMGRGKGMLGVIQMGAPPAGYVGVSVGVAEKFIPPHAKQMLEPYINLELM